MAEPLLPDQPGGLDALANAVRKSKAGDPRRIPGNVWASLGEVLVRHVAQPESCLIREGEHQRSVYFVESGLLRIFRSHEGNRLQLGVFGAGALVGEGAFFAPVARSASVEAIETAIVWELSSDSFDAMAERAPQHALTFSLYVGAVMSTRLLRPAGRLSIT